MKRFFNWVAELLGCKAPVKLPTVSHISGHPGFFTCVVRPSRHIGPPFFIHFLSIANPNKLEGVANRVGVELADALSQRELGEHPLRFNFSGTRDALNNWRNQPAIAEIRKIVRSMDIFASDEHYLALSSYGSPALMFRAALLENVLMTVCFSQSDMLSENEPVEWLRDDPVRGFTVPKMALSTGDNPRLSFVQKGSRGNSIALMLSPELGYELEKVQYLASVILDIAHHAPSNGGLSTLPVEKYLDIAAHTYAKVRACIDVTVVPGYYYESTLGVFVLALVVNNHPPMILAFMPEGFVLDNLPSVAELTSAIRESVNWPYPIGNVFGRCGEPALSVNEFHEIQVRARVAPITRLVFDKTMDELMKSSGCPGEELNHRFSQSDVYALFSLTSCPPEFARVVAEKCENLRRFRAKDLAGNFITQYHEEHGNEYSDARIDAFIAKHCPVQGVLETEVRIELLQLGVNKRNREFASRAARRAAVSHHFSTRIERPGFRTEIRPTVQHPDPMVQAAVLATIMENDPPAHRCETPVSEPVCRDESPSYDCGSSNTYNPD